MKQAGVNTDLPSGPQDPPRVYISVEELESENAQLRSALNTAREVIKILNGENQELQMSKQHMDACRELLDVPSDDVLYSAIEELQAKYSSLLSFGSDVHGECKALREECERLRKAASSLSRQFLIYADNLETNPGDNNPRQQRSGMVIMCRQSADRLDAALTHAPAERAERREG